MKPVLLLLLAAAVACNANFITIRSQPMPQSSGMQGPRLYVVNSQNEEAAPRVLGLLSRLQMQPSAGAMQDLASPFSTVLGGRSSSFFDTSLSKWMDQQMATLDQLQAQLGPPPVLTSGCPRLAAMRAAAAAAGAASLPQDALSYLAASRFGPGLLASFPQQVRDAPFDAGWRLAGAGDEDAGFVDEEDAGEDDGEDDGEELSFDAGGVGEYWVGVGGDGLAAASYQQQQQPLAMLTASGVGLAGPRGRGFMPSMLSEDDSAAFYPASGMATNVEVKDEDDDGPTWFFVLQDGSLNWGLVCFLALALAVVPLWLWNIRALVRLLAGVPSSSPAGGCRRFCPFSRPGAARAQAAPQAQSLKAPLLAECLAPLAPEKPVAEKPAPEILTAVEVASEQAPHGEYVAPSNNQFVTVRYVPLKGEEV